MTVLIAFDGSPDSRRAIEFAAAHLAPQPLVVVTVWETLLAQAARYGAVAGIVPVDLGPDEAETDARNTAEEGVRLAREAGFTDVTAQPEFDRSSIGQTLVEVAEETGASLVVTGTRGLGAVRAMFLGSVSNFLTHHAARPVLVVPSPGEREDPPPAQ